MPKLKIITSWDDGHPLDLKLARLLKKYHMPGIFYIPLSNSEREVMTPRQIKKLSRDFEIGAHTLNHTELTKISFNQAKEEIASSKHELEKIIGRPVTKFCYPKGLSNSKIVELVKKAGFKSARTANWFRLDKEFDPFRQLTTVHFYPHPFWENIAHCLRWRNGEGLRVYLKHGCPVSPFELVKIFYQQAKDENGIFHLWGHSWEIEEKKLWSQLKKTLAWLTSGNEKSNWEKEELEYWDKRVYAPKLKSKLQVKRGQIAGNRNYPLERNLFSKIRNQIKGKTLIEIGCGDAGFVANLLDPKAYDYQYIGIDISENALKLARKNLRGNASLYCQSIENLSSAKFRCDVLLAIGAIHHAESQEELIGKLSPLVKKGGFLLLNEPLARPGILGFIFRRILKPIVPEIKHEARLNEGEILEEVKNDFKVVHLRKEVSPLRTLLILFLVGSMDRSLGLTKIVSLFDNLIINSLGRIFPVFGGGELYLVARKNGKN